MPLSCPGGNALWSNVRLDICRTAAAVTTERARAGVVGEGVRVAHHSAERLGQLELAGLFKRLIAETAGRVVVLTRDRGLPVTESPDCILEAVEVHGVAQACFSNWLTCGATVAEAKAVAAPTEDHGEEDDHTLRGIAAETVLTGSGRDVGK